MLLTNPVPSWMTATQQSIMPGTVVIERYTMTPDGAGNQYEAWAAVGTVIGRIYPQRTQGLEMVGGAQVLSETRWWGTLPVGTDVIERDRLVYSGRSWEVTRVNNDEMFQTAVRAELESENEERRT